MQKIKPKLVDGVAFWNVDPKNKKAFNELFQGKITEIFNKETKAKGSPLTKKEISNLRSHPDLGVWVIDGKPASVTDLNQFLSKKKSTLSLYIPKRKNQYFTRKMLESPKNMPREVRRWFKRLDDKGWPTGRSKKGFVNYLNRAYDQTVEYNKILEKRLGFSFDAGHFWGAMGPEGDRTIIGPYGARSEGKFTFRNVTSQPRTPSMNQLLNPKWNVITPNVPGFFDKRSVQVTGAQELLDVGGGGQGWSGSLTDYLTEGLNDIDKMNAWEKAYIAFGDPQKGASGTAESRLAELVEPGGKDRVFKRIGKYAETSEDLSGPVRTITKGSERWWELQKAINIAKKVQEIPGVKPTLEVLDTARRHPVATTLTTIPVLSAFDVVDAAESGTALLKDDYSDENEEKNKLQKMSDQYKFTSATTGIASLNPVAAPVAVPTSAVSAAIHLVLKNRLHRMNEKEKRIDNFLNPKNFGQTELKQYDPYEGISTL